MSNREIVLVVAAHPDDEVLGCGGTIAKHVDNGDQVHVLIMSEGITSRSIKRDRLKDNKELTELAKAANKANSILGVSSLELMDYPDNRMDSIELLDLVKEIEKIIHKLSPTIVYTHYSNDLNIDHQIISKAVVTACRPIPDFSVKNILFFEVPSSTEWQINNYGMLFTPNWYVDLTGCLDIKLKALKAYSSEMRDWPHSRSLKAVEYLAHWRGASVGCDSAEAFMLGRAIN